LFPSFFFKTPATQVLLLPDKMNGRADTLRVATYNVHRCVGLDWRRSERRIAEVIAGLSADIVGLQELSVPTSGARNQAAIIAQQLGWNLLFHPALTRAHEDFGDAIISRHPLRLVRAAELPGKSPWYCREPRAAMWAEVETDQGPVQMMNTHLGLNRRERLVQAQWLASEEWLGRVPRDVLLVMVGDWNFLPGSKPHRTIMARLRDSRESTTKQLPTFPTWFPLFAVDHILVSQNFRVVNVHVHRSARARIASDHFPLVAELRKVCP
jgi:endonuclease/exonuclease/phosphatase family metal-dependent hydrolase